MEITQDKLKEALHYDAETGVVTWRQDRKSNKVKGEIAGYLSPFDGYRRIRINNNLYLAHRLIWVYVMGTWPSEHIDHVDGARDNNKFSNLRQATSKQNCENICIAKNNTSGYRGVYFDKSCKKWKAAVRHYKQRFHLGYFETAEEAGKAAAAKRAELFTHDTGRDQVNTFA
jgi:hypothetical protein